MPNPYKKKALRVNDEKWNYGGDFGQDMTQEDNEKSGNDFSIYTQQEFDLLHQEVLVEQKRRHMSDRQMMIRSLRENIKNNPNFGYRKNRDMLRNDLDDIDLDRGSRNIY